MDKQAWFMQYSQLKQQLEDDRMSLSRLSASLTDTSAPEIRENPVQVSPDDEAPFARILTEIDRLKAKVQLEERLLAKLRAQIVVLISTLHPSRYDLMLARYISCLKWEDICKEKLLTKPTAMRWHREILDSLTLPDDAVNVRESLGTVDSLGYNPR